MACENQHFDTQVGVPINAQLPAGFDYTVIRGQLPPGVTLSASGVISGTPTVAGYQVAIVEECAA